jgi:hypothetical protein
MNDQIQPLNISEVIKQSWTKVSGSKKSFWVILSCVFLLQLASITIGKGMKYLLEVMSLVALLATINLVLKIFRLILTWGLAYLGIKRAQDSNINYNMVGYVFDAKLILNLCGMYILEFLILLPATLLLIWPLIVEENFNLNGNAIFNMSVVTSLIAGAISMLYLLMRLYLTSTIIIAEKIGPIMAIKRSFKVTKAHVWQLLGLNIFNLLILFLSLIALGIGLIWTLPYVFICYGVVYKKLVLNS